MRIFLLLLTIIACCHIGCAPAKSSARVDYRTATGSTGGDPESAQAHFTEAINLLCVNNLCDAEQALHQSLICDGSFGPAHNALGKIYFDQKKFYLAAWEFEHANRLMAGRPEPINNLGLVYESVGQLDKAIQWFLEANTIDESNPQYLGNLIRARIRRGDKTSDLHFMLERLIVMDDRPEWRTWARKQIAVGTVDAPIVPDYPAIERDPYGHQNKDPEIAPPDLESHSRPIIEPIEDNR